MIHHLAPRMSDERLDKLLALLSELQRLRNRSPRDGRRWRLAHALVMGVI